MGESRKAFVADTDVKTRTHIGGQALIEGIMMRGRYNWAVAVRQPDGEIYTEEHDLASGKKKNAWMYWPIIRGCTAFVESLALGYKALSISSEHAYDWEEDEGGNAGAGDSSTVAQDDAEKLDAAALDGAGNCVIPSEGRRQAPGAEESRVESQPDARSFDSRFALAQDDMGEAIRSLRMTEESQPDANAQDDSGNYVIPSEGRPQAPGAEESRVESQPARESSGGIGALMSVSMVIGLVLGIVIFVVLPAALSNLVLGEQNMNSAAWNIFDGIVRVAIFIAYIWLISLMKDIKRMFGYHGAEHKTIHCYEHGEELTPQNAMKYPRLHVRCGTAFMIMVMIIAIFIYTALGQPINALVDMTGVQDGPLRFVLIVLTRIILMPIIAGCSYEVTVKWAGKRPENLLVRIILWPGMQMQRLTTNPPDESMLECAIAAMNIVLAREELEAKKAAAEMQENEATTDQKQAA